MTFPVNVQGGGGTFEEKSLEISNGGIEKRYKSSPSPVLVLVFVFVVS